VPIIVCENTSGTRVWNNKPKSFFTLKVYQLRRNLEKGKAAAAPSNIKEIQEIQGGQEAPHNGGAINPKDA